MANTINFKDLKGIENVMKGLNKELKRMKGEITSKGFIRVAMLIRNTTENRYPITPVDTGNLRASWFVAIKDNVGAFNAGQGFSTNRKKRKSKRDTQFQQLVVSTARAAVQANPNPVMIFGFAANYAAIVHENLAAKNWQRPNSGPKFLEIALRTNEKQILRLLADSIKIG